jgi:threonine aldolase
VGDEAIELRSDNAAGVTPEVMAAIAAADEGSALAYGGDEWTARLTDRVREVFEHPGASVFPVLSGTAANALGLSAMAPPWGAVLCHETAHILRSEAAATSMFGGGLALRGLPGPDAKLTPESVHAAYDETWWDDPHHSQPAVVSLTCPTDRGTVYDVAEVAALGAIARERGLRLHVDGARVANAMAALGCSPAELTWHAGVDVLSLGATKNGAMSTDAIVCFDADVHAELVYRTKRAGHVASKMRYLSAQLDAYLRDGNWLRRAADANAAMGVLASGLRGAGVELLHEPAVNIAFARVGAAAAERLDAAGVRCYSMGGGIVRFVTSWQTTADAADEAVRRIVACLE